MAGPALLNDAAGTSNPSHLTRSRENPWVGAAVKVFVCCCEFGAVKSGSGPADVLHTSSSAGQTLAHNTNKSRDSPRLASTSVPTLPLNVLWLLLHQIISIHPFSAN